VADPEGLPAWGKALVSWLEVAGHEEAGPGPFGALSASARAWLKLRRASLDVQVEDSAIDDLVVGLEARLWRACVATFDYEAQLAAELARVLQRTTEPQAGMAALDGTLDAWRARLIQLPGMARVVGVICHHWQRSTDELLARLGNDLLLVGRRVFDGRTPGPLVGVRIDLGDLHGGGRAVALLTFADGARLFYKPKDLRVAEAFLELARFLNRRSLCPELPLWRVVPRGAYAWEEAVEPSTCQEPRELDRFYVRLGMLARLFQLLGARDLWLDNLVAARDCPAFIDLETMLQPSLPEAWPATATDAQRAAAARWSASVAALDMLAMPTPIGPGVPAEELGVLAPPGAFRSPFRYQWHEAPVDRHTVGPAGYILWRHSQHAATLRGQVVDPAAFFPRIVEGYRALHATLVHCQGELAMRGGPLDALQSSPVRFIPRDTWTYLRLIDQSVVPPLLADPLARECLLARLFSSLPPGTAEGYRAQLVACEIEALRDLDVPYFSADPATTSVRDPRGVEVAQVFPTDAWSRLRTRVTELSSFALDEEEALLRSTLATSAPGRCGQPVAVVVHRRGPGRISADELVDRAVGVGEAVLGTAVADPQAGLGWVGLVDQPLLGCRQLQPIGPDPLSGTGGIALMFGELYETTGEPRWRRAAERALEGVVLSARQAGEILGRLLERPGSEGVPIVCGLVGIGGALYVLRALARSLQEPSLLDEVARACATLPMKDLGRRAPLDLVVGGTGLLLAIVGDADQASEELAEGLFERADKPVSGLVGPPVLCSQLPDPRATLGLAAARLAISRGSRTLRDLVANLAGRADLELAAEEPEDCLGLALGALSIPSQLLDPGRVRAWIDALGRRRPPPKDAPTRQVLDELELLLLRDRHGDPAAKERAFGLVDVVIARQASTGSWFPETFAADRHCLSTLDGLPALVHAFLRLAGASDSTHGSVRTLDLGRQP
jgi:type 2 lantibiotic biosynthesis protein LanM